MTETTERAAHVEERARLLEAARIALEWEAVWETILFQAYRALDGAADGNADLRYALRRVLNNPHDPEGIALLRRAVAAARLAP